MESAEVEQRLAALRDSDLADLLGSVILRVRARIAAGEFEQAARQLDEWDAAFGGQCGALAARALTSITDQRTRAARAAFARSNQWRSSAMRQFETAVLRADRAKIERWRWAPLAYGLGIGTFLRDRAFIDSNETEVAAVKTRVQQSGVRTVLVLRAIVGMHAEIVRSAKESRPVAVAHSLRRVQEAADAANSEREEGARKLARRQALGLEVGSDFLSPDRAGQIGTLRSIAAQIAALEQLLRTKKFEQQEQARLALLQTVRGSLAELDAAISLQPSAPESPPSSVSSIHSAPSPSATNVAPAGEPSSAEMPRNRTAKDPASPTQRRAPRPAHAERPGGLSSDPYSQARMHHAAKMMEMALYDEALVEFEAVAQLHPRDADCLARLAAVLAFRGGWDRARGYAARATQTNPGHSLSDAVWLLLDPNSDRERAGAALRLVRDQGAIEPALRDVLEALLAKRRRPLG